MQKKSVIYINFSPYDNTGRILDFLIDNYYLLAHFSFDHLRIKNTRRPVLTIYKQGKVIKKVNLSWFKTPSYLLFPSLPIVAIIMLFETLYHSYNLKSNYGKIDYFLSVNAFPVTSGIILKKLGIVDKTVFWVWDYFPTNFPDWRLRLIRKTYMIFDNFALKNSDKIVFLNKFLKKSREDQGIDLKNKQFHITPIGTNPKSKLHTKKENIIGHMGLIKDSQGLNLIFENLDECFEKFPNLKLEIIGTGPEEVKFKRISRKHKNRVKFYGFMDDANKIDSLINKWKIGLATYIPAEWSEHYWGDPSKIKAYISNGVPVITTNVPEFSKEIKSKKVGIVIQYNKNDLFDAIELLIKENKGYSENALNLAKEYIYKKIYPKLLS